MVQIPGLQNIDWNQPLKSVYSKASTGISELETYISEKVLKGWSPAEIPDMSGAAVGGRICAHDSLHDHASVCFRALYGTWRPTAPWK
jgi:hypothetical protein